jgi:hypothetical protein
MNNVATVFTYKLLLACDTYAQEHLDGYSAALRSLKLTYLHLCCACCCGLFFALLLLQLHWKSLHQ